MEILYVSFVPLGPAIKSRDDGAEERDEGAEERDDGGEVIVFP